MSYGINHQVGVKASPEEIYKYLTETAKLAQWWTTDTRGSGAKVGDTLEFSFRLLPKVQYQGANAGKACRLEIPERPGFRRMGGD